MKTGALNIRTQMTKVIANTTHTAYALQTEHVNEREKQKQQSETKNYCRWKMCVLSNSDECTERIPDTHTRTN